MDCATKDGESHKDTPFTESSFSVAWALLKRIQLDNNSLLSGPVKKDVEKFFTEDGLKEMVSELRNNPGKLGSPLAEEVSIIVNGKRASWPAVIMMGYDDVIKLAGLKVGKHYLVTYCGGTQKGMLLIEQEIAIEKDMIFIASDTSGA